jgi:hypothetical protein
MCLASSDRDDAMSLVQPESSVTCGSLATNASCVAVGETASTGYCTKVFDFVSWCSSSCVLGTPCMAFGQSGNCSSFAGVSVCSPISLPSFTPCSGTGPCIVPVLNVTGACYDNTGARVELPRGRR